MTDHFKQHSNPEYGKFIALSRYARWLPEENRRETWEETVKRYIHFWVKRYSKEEIDYDILHELEGAILNLEVMPSMRGLMVAGEAGERDNVAFYNCAFRAIDGDVRHIKAYSKEVPNMEFEIPLKDIKAFDEIVYILMCGTGVGFSVERQFINNLPTIGNKLDRSIYARTEENFPGVSKDELSTFSRKNNTIYVADSKYGWASAVRILITELYNGNVPGWNTDKVRGPGAPLKTFGGRSSGPEVLENLFVFLVETFKRANGRKLNSLECHDICCKIAEIVVVGGVRRSACISLSNLTDERMRHAKSGEWWNNDAQRAMANNSVCYTEKPDIGIFMREWESLYASKSGERGFFNREAAKKVAAKNGRRDPNHEWGTNPCLHPDSLIETINGRTKIKDIVEPTMVYSMDNNGALCIRSCSASWISKKNAETIKLSIASGKQVVCTPDHKIYTEGRGWIAAQDIHIGDRVVHLVRNRRGAAYSGVKLTSQEGRSCIQMEHRFVWEGINGAVPKGYDIHHIDNNTYNNDIENLECISHNDHSTLTRLEYPNNHQIYGYTGKGVSGYGFLNGNGLYKKPIIPMPNELKSNLHQYATIVSISEGPVTDVYDLTVEETHNFIADFVVVHNCSEIILRDRQFCNLSEVVVRSGDTFDDLRRKVRLAAILGTLQATLTDFKYLSPRWKENTEEEALLGVSLTGIMDHAALSGREWMPWFNTNIKVSLQKVLEELKGVAIETNKEWADRLGISRAAAITCVKPSGCRPLTALVTSEEGILTLDELDPGGKEVWTDISGNSHGGKISKYYRNGLANLYQINMRYGISVQSTANHQWFVNGEWKRTDEVIEGDQLEIQANTYSSTDDQPLIFIPWKGCKQVRQLLKQPSSINQEIAWLIGYLWGDGTLSHSKYRLRFIDEHIEHLQKVQNILKDQFGINTKIHPASQGRKAYTLEYGSHHLWNWLIENGFWKYREDGGLNNIPKIIRQSSSSSIRAFFAGWLDADGWYRDGKGCITTADSIFAEHAQNVGWSVGLALGRSHNTLGENFQKKKSMWLMHFSSHTTGEAWEDMIKNSCKIIGPIKHSKKQRSGIVYSVQNIGVKETFDIETENHWFFAGSVKSHNTVSQLVDSASGIHSRFSPYYIRTVRADKKDPLTQFMIEAGFPVEDDITKPGSTSIFSFPMKSPEGSSFNNDRSAIEQLELWKIYQDHWCVTGDTQILTRYGHRKIEECVNMEVCIWNGQEFSKVVPYETGLQGVYRVGFNDGAAINMTANHELLTVYGKKELKDCNVGTSIVNDHTNPIIKSIWLDGETDAYSQGFYSGDGYTTGNWTLVYPPKYPCLKRLVGTVNEKETSNRGRYWKHSDASVIDKDYVPDNSNISYKLDWLAGLIDSDGNRLGKGFQISSVDKSFLLKIKLMLVSLGSKCIIQKKEQSQFGVRPCYYLNVSGKYTTILLELGLKTERVELIGARTITKDRELTITSIEYLGKEHTYCFTEDKLGQGVFNGILTGQCEHKPSITVYVKEHEWMEVGAWVYKNFDDVSGISFLPHTDHTYKQAPYQAITEEEYKEWLDRIPQDIDWTRLSHYEKIDTTVGSKTYACSAGSCEIVDLASDG